MDCLEKSKHLGFELQQRIRLALALFINSSFSSESCSGCGRKVLVPGLCSECRKKFFNFSPPGPHRCSVCGQELLSEEGKCTSCRSDPMIVSADMVFPLHGYRLWNKKLVFDWKMAEKRWLSPIFAEGVYRAFESLGIGKDVLIVPVPPRKGKVRSKGWDQVQELCSILHLRYGYVIFNALERISAVQQKQLDREGRVLSQGKNYKIGKNFFRYTEKYGIPEEIVLLDDVITTGVTVEGCAYLLKRAGIRKVNIVSLFKVD